RTPRGDRRRVGTRRTVPPWMVHRSRVRYRQRDGRPAARVRQRRLVGPVARDAPPGPAPRPTRAVGCIGTAFGIRLGSHRRVDQHVLVPPRDRARARRRRRIALDQHERRRHADLLAPGRGAARVAGHVGRHHPAGRLGNLAHRAPRRRITKTQTRLRPVARPRQPAARVTRTVRYSMPSALAIVWNRSVWFVIPTTFAACGPWAATRTSVPVWLCER